MKMLSTILTAVAAIVAATPASAQDWTIEVPLEIEQLVSGVEEVVVHCYIGTIEAPAEGDLSGIPGDFVDDVITGGSERLAMGETTLPVGDDGSVSGPAIVEMSAPDKSDAEKNTALSWACTFTLDGPAVSDIEGFSPPVGPMSVGHGISGAEAITARDGTLTILVGGSLPRSAP